MPSAFSTGGQGPDALLSLKVLSSSAIPGGRLIQTHTWRVTRHYAHHRGKMGKFLGMLGTARYFQADHALFSQFKVYLTLET